MDIKISDKALRKFLSSPVTPEELAKTVSLCGPTFDRINKLDNDYLYDIEVITNRIDTASAQGIARDAVAILNQQGVKSSLINDPYLEKIDLHPNLPKTFSFDIADQTLVPRMVAVSIENIEIKESPSDVKELLSSCGQRPINNVVDITNELTLLYGMPSHIFDLDKLAAQKLIIRESKKGEEVTTLNNLVNKLNGGDIIIEDGAGRNVDLCGVMGGSIAEVDQYTKNILLIVPVYHPTKVRRTSLYLQNRTLASQIYEKQPDHELCLPVLMRAIKLFEERANGKVSSSVFDSNPNPHTSKKVILDVKWATNLIGIDISSDTIITILESLGFKTKSINNGALECTVPSWRYHDINIREDLVEEIARVYGYFKLPPIIPLFPYFPEPKDKILKTESKIKNYLSCQGFNEIFNNSLISIDLINKTSLDEKKHLKLNNALSQDFEYLRTSLVPSILQNIKNNQGKSEEPFHLFEVSNVYIPSNEKLPNEMSKCVITSTENFRLTKGYLESLFSHLNIRKYNFVDSNDSPVYFASENTAKIISGNTTIGYIGQINKVILHNLGITSNPVVIEMDTKNIVDSISENYVYEPISEFPEVVEQMTISSNKKVGEIVDQIRSISNLINKIIYTDSYQNKHSFKITFSSPTKNLTQSEVNEIKEKITNAFN